MFARYVKLSAVKPAGFALNSKIAQQARFLATVEGSAGRAMPATRPRATPVSHDRATFTIRVRSYTNRCEGQLLTHTRMDQFSTESLSAQSRTSLEKPSSPPPSLDTPSP
jgi:hypothetical protein